MKYPCLCAHLFCIKSWMFRSHDSFCWYLNETNFFYSLSKQVSLGGKNGEAMVWKLWKGTAFAHVVPWSPGASRGFSHHLICRVSFTCKLTSFVTSFGGYCRAATTSLLKPSTQLYKTQQLMKHIQHWTGSTIKMVQMESRIKKYENYMINKEGHKFLKDATGSSVLYFLIPD